MELSRYKSIETLLELRGLIDKEQRMFIDQAIHFLYQEDRQNFKSLSQDKFENIRKNAISLLKENLFEFVKQNPNLTQINFNETAQLDLESLNTMDPVWPSVLNLIAQFNPCGSIAIEYVNKKMEISFTFDSNSFDLREKTSLRPLAYKVQKQLLAKNIIMTYRIIGEDRLSFLVDLSSKFTQYQKVSLDNDVSLIFDNYFSGYEASLDLIISLGRHLVFVIDKSGQVYRETRISERDKSLFTDSKYDNQIFHYPFLFRPISIIIPRGKRLVRQSMEVAALEFDNNFEARNAETFKLSKNSVFVNFFKLFSK